MIVYLVTNLVNGKRYVGLTTKTLKQRWEAHIDRANGKYEKFALHHAIAKYGVFAFKVDELYCLIKKDITHLREAEQCLVSAHNTLYPVGYNLTKGGEGMFGFKHSPESIEKMSKNRSGIPVTDEQKRKLSVAMKGRVRSKEFGRAVSARQKGIPLSEERKRNMSIAQLGHKHTLETRLKMTKTRTGVKLSKEHRSAMSAGWTPEVKEGIKLRKFLKTVAWG